MGCMDLAGKWQKVSISAEHEAQARAFLDAAEELGVNFFDHANIYAHGRAEEVFGRVMRERPGLRDRIVLQSKAGIRWTDEPPGTPMRYDFSREHLLEAVEGASAGSARTTSTSCSCTGPTCCGSRRRSLAPSTR